MKIISQINVEMEENGIIGVKMCKREMGKKWMNLSVPAENSQFVPGAQIMQAKLSCLHQSYPHLHCVWTEHHAFAWEHAGQSCKDYSA